MKNKIIKYTKFIISVALILSLIAPSYASLSAADGSAFVTKAEFDSALADFNSRLTTFEAGINSKIDSQVTSYLDRNGIWNGKEQEFWKWWEEPAYISLRNTLDDKEICKYAPGDNFSPFVGIGSTAGVPLIKNITKSGLLQYYIPCLWWEGNDVENHLRDRMWTFWQTDPSNMEWCTTASYTSAHLALQAGASKMQAINSISTNKTVLYTTLAAPYIVKIKDLSLSKVRYSSFDFLMSSDASRINNYRIGNLTWVNAGAAAPTAKMNKTLSSIYLYDADATQRDIYVAGSFTAQGVHAVKNVLTGNKWEWDAGLGRVKWKSTADSTWMDQVTLVSGFVFVEKGKPLYVAPGCGVFSFYYNQSAPVSTNWVRTSGTAALIKVY